MKVIILSAGLGSRLQSPAPKSLINFYNGRNILNYQLAVLANFLPIWDIYIVVGFKKELVMEAASRCTFIYNERYDRTNTAKSLLMALERMDDDVLWINGDVFFSDKEIISHLMSEGANSILVNREKISDEEVCYTLNSMGCVQKLSKGLGELADGEALGINFIRRADLTILISLLHEVEDCDYFERAMELGIERGLLEFKIVNIGQVYVKEMDFQCDYEDISRYLSNGVS
jgi:choline kinase